MDDNSKNCFNFNNKNQKILKTSRNKKNNLFNNLIITTLSITKVKTFDNKVPKYFDISLYNYNLTFKPKDDYFIQEMKQKKRNERKKKFKEFLLRNQASLERKREILERKNLLLEREKKIKSEHEIIEGFNRLIDDANRRFEARERAEHLMKEVISSSKKDNNKKYNSSDWKNIYEKRFLNYENKHKDKINKAHLEKENEIKKKENDIINEMKSFNKKVSKNQANIIFNSLYNKGRKIFNEKKKDNNVNKSQILERNKSNDVNNLEDKNTRNKTPVSLKQNKSISKYKNIQPRYMNFFQNINETTLSKLKEDKNEFEKSKNSTMKSKNSNNNNNNNNTNKSKNSTMKSKISYSSNDSILKIFQSNFIQTIKFKNIPNDINENDNDNIINVDDINNKIKNSKNQSKKVSKTETNVTSKKIFTPPPFNETEDNNQNI